MMEIYVNGKQTKILLQDVHVISGLRKNLLSISQLAKKGIHTSINEQGASLWKLDDTKAKFIVGCATWDNGICYLNGQAIVSAVASVAAKPNHSIMELHARLGHINVEDVAMIENHDLADGLHITDKKRSDCDACRERKQTRSAKAQTETSESAPTNEIGAVIGVHIKTHIKPHVATLTLCMSSTMRLAMEKSFRCVLSPNGSHY